MRSRAVIEPANASAFANFGWPKPPYLDIFWPNQEVFDLAICDGQNPLI